MGLFKRKHLICPVCGKEAGALRWEAADGKFCNDCFARLKGYGYTSEDWFDEPVARIQNWIETSERIHKYDRPGEAYGPEEKQKMMKDLEADAEEIFRVQQGGKV